MDEVHGHTATAEPLQREPGILRGHAERPAQLRRHARSPRRRQAEAATAEPEVDRRQQIGGRLEHLIEPADAEIRGAALHVQGHVAVLEDHETCRGSRRDDQLSGRARLVFRHDSRVREPLERGLLQPALRQGDGQHASGTSASRSSENPTAGRGSPKRPSRVSYRPPPPTGRGAPVAYRLKTMPV